MKQVPKPQLDGLSPERVEMMCDRMQRQGLDFGNKVYSTLVAVEKQLSAPGKPWSKYYQPTFPKDYQYSDGEAGKKIEPKPLYGTARKPGSSAELPVVFADWLTAPENDRFALTLANRLWKWMFGAALCGPVREVKVAEKAADRALMRQLEGLVIGTGYDLKQTLRILANTQAYQREAVNAKEDDAHPALHPGPLLRRLTAEQIWDSLITLMDGDPDAEIAAEKEERSAHFKTLVASKTPDEFWHHVVAEHDRKMAAGETFTAGEQLKGRVKKLGFDAAALRRASETQQPAPDGHFLRLFGQSNREIMDNSWTAATVPQALTLMNGPLFEQIRRPESGLQQALASTTTPEQRIEAIFLAVLARKPTAAEIALVLDSANAPEDLAWTLLNTRHFLFLQ
jgi:hypothetical protein